MHTEIQPLLNIFIQKELETILSLVDYRTVAAYSDYLLKMYKYIKDQNTMRQSLGLGYTRIQEIVNVINEVSNIGLIKFNSLISDAYLLARIFKTFKINNTEGKHIRRTDEPAEPHNIIIYAGNAHSQRYRLFLKYLGFRVLERSGPLEKPLPDRTNCVNLEDISQPFFSNCPYNTKDNPLDTDFFGNEAAQSYYLSFEKVFTFDTDDITRLFTRPVVPTDLRSSVSYNYLESVGTTDLRSSVSYNPSVPENKTAYGKMPTPTQLRKGQYRSDWRDYRRDWSHKYRFR